MKSVKNKLWDLRWPLNNKHQSLEGIVFYKLIQKIFPSTNENPANSGRLLEFFEEFIEGTKLQSFHDSDGDDITNKTESSSTLANSILLTLEKSLFDDTLKKENYRKN